MPKKDEHSSIEKTINTQTEKLLQVDTIENEREAAYLENIKLMNSINSMTLCNEKVDMYQRVAQKFSELSDYNDADELSRECQKQADQVDEQIKKMIYEKALNIKASAKTAANYRLAIEELRKISGYRDADALASECENLYNRSEKNLFKNGLLNKGVGLLVIIVIIFAILSPYTKYYLARGLAKTGSNSAAITFYSGLGTFKDTKARLARCEYYRGVYLESKGDYKNSKVAYAASKGYKDGDKRKVAMEKLILKSSVVGDTVYIGETGWIILEMQNDKVLLYKKTALTDLAFNDTATSVTWENSTLRQYLNSEFLNINFSKAERKNILSTEVKNDDNAQYNIEGGNNTQDKVFLLSIEEAETYVALLQNIKNVSWLRSPGNSEGTAAFLSAKGAIMDYGYIVNSDDLTVSPAIWFNIK
jgi:hypothetical protein